jgi:hypothetical protein
MKIVQGDELHWERGLEYRGGMFHFRRLMEGEPGTIDNFQLSLGKMSGEFYSPRHRHNFEQIRFQVKGTLNYARDGKMTEGIVGYFPEGMAYGPQSQDPDSEPWGAVLQFGGASGSGYLSRDEVKAGMTELSKVGTFSGGVFRRNPGEPGKKNLDGYQAIWEHKNGKAMVYPKPRYNHPILMDPKNFAWIETDTKGVSEKLLGIYSERRVEIALVKIEAGAAYTCGAPTVFLTTSGTGAAANQPLREFTTVWVARGDRVTFKADETVEMLRMGLPDLTGLEGAKRTEFAQAAE